MSAEAWQGPPSDSIGWWQSRVPEASKGSATPAPTPVLLSTLETLLMEGTHGVLATMLALLLVRRRILVEPAATSPEAPFSDDSPSRTLHLVHASTEREFFVPICEPSLDECSFYQDQLTRLLFVED
jgi:hypothetical protein